MSIEHSRFWKRRGLFFSLSLMVVFAAAKTPLWAHAPRPEKPSGTQASRPGFTATEENLRGGNAIQSIRTVQGTVEIELTSATEFPVRDELVRLRIGAQEFTRSRPPRDGRLNALIFTLTAEQFDKLADGDEVIVQYGRDGASQRWRFGKLDKRLKDKKK